MSVREQLEAGLSARGWGATLARGHAAGERQRARGVALVAGGITELTPDAGGAGTTACALRLAAGWEGRIAWADPDDRFDPESAERAGVALERVLWLRGEAKLRGMEGLSRWNEILNLVIQSHAVELVVADFLDWPLAELRRIPRSAWFRLLRGLEHGQQTALLLLTPAPVASTCVRARLTPGVLQSQVARHFLPWSLPSVAWSAGFDSRRESATGAFRPAGTQGSSKLPPQELA